jgi:hypothetical protein
MLEAVDPLLDVGLAVVGPGEDVGDPDGDQPAVGEALVEGMWGEMAVEDLGGVSVGSGSPGAGGWNRIGASDYAAFEVFFFAVVP